MIQIQNKKFIALKLLLLLSFFILGIYLRTRIPHETSTLNTVAFYFSRAEYLEKNGEYLKYDNTTFAGYSYKENYPPFPALMYVPIYKLAKIFGIDFNNYISYFPILMYVLIFLAGFLSVKNLFGFDAGMFFSIIWSIIPVAVDSTTKNYYTEEALGILLIILSINFLCKINKFDRNFWLSALFLTLLSLTWQVFLLLFFAIGIAAMFSIREKHLFITYSALLILPFILGHIFSVYLIGIDYSPIYMVKESLITLKEGKQDYFKIAFNRTNLETPGAKNIINEFGYITPFLIITGFIALFLNFGKQKNRLLFISGIIAAASFLQSVKFKYFAAGHLIIIGAIGSESLIGFFSLKRLQKIFILSVLAVFALLFFLKNVEMPSCAVAIDSPENIETGKYYPIVFTVKNKGFNPLCENKSGAFGGLHVEFGNATILNSSIYPEQSKTIGYKVQSDEFNWFEAIIDCIHHGEEVKVTAWIMPKSENVKLNYRCWLPKKYCNQKAPSGLMPQYSAGWRNEKCVNRYPSSGNLCDVDVFAGYFNKTKFFCESKDLH